MDTSGSVLFFWWWCLKGLFEVASKICRFRKRFEARLQLFFLAPEEHGEESLWPERLNMKIHTELVLPCFFLKK